MSSGQQFIELFAQLDIPKGQGDALVLRACPVAGSPQIRIAKDSRSRPALLVKLNDPAIEEAPVIELVNFSYQPSAACFVDHEGSTEQQTLALLLCRAEDRELQEWFLRTVGAIIGELTTSNVRQRELDLAVDRLVQLFLALGRAPSTSVQGLWGELAVIAHSPDPRFLLTAWHADPMEPHDFVAGLTRIEVKTARGTRREHHFSLEQLLCPQEARLMVVSLLVQPSPAGASIDDLVGVIETRVVESAGMIAKLHEVVSATLGSDWRRAADQRYSVPSALESLAMFDGRHIPMVSPDLPLEVSDVRFKVEMWGLPTLEPANVAEVSLWSAAMPSTQLNG